MRNHYKVALLTVAYWLYETRQSGNIRVDLLLFYPLMFGFYSYWLWPRFKWLALLLAVALMAANLLFMQHSYGWFHKYLG